MSVVEDMLMNVPLETLHEMEREAECDFRASKTMQELVTREAEWRAIEAVYTKRLTEKR